MTKKTYSRELERTLARPDADEMRQQLLAYGEHIANGAREWPDEVADDFDEIMTCHFDDPEKSFACVIMAASQSDDPRFLALMACGNLEDVLGNPSPDLLSRVVSEARKSARFRWLLSHPFRVAIAPEVWEATEKFRISGPHEEPPTATLPPRD